MPRRSPEEKAADLFRQGKAVFTQRSWDPQVPTVREAYRSLPEWFARRGGVFAWDRPCHEDCEENGQEIDTA
jgi:hypothetical protein